ncbi:MAG: BadF/BadG/BcrA/BcrD ATPase family protein [Chloroflexia bacterium]
MAEGKRQAAHAADRESSLLVTRYSSLVLGLNAGGTRTVALLAEAGSGAVLGRGVGGPGNIRAVGAGRATEAVAAAIAAAFADAGREQGPVAAVAIGAAGAARPDDRAAVEDCLRAVIAAGRYAVTNDAAIALRAAVPSGPAVLLIAGTGSIGYGRAADGREVRAGGWGYLLDDDGSAYAVGLAGLSAVLRAHDGRRPQTALRGVLLAAAGLAAPEEIVGWVYRQPTPRDEIAALAPVVADAARAGDEVAVGIVAAAGEALGTLAVAVLRQLDAAAGAAIPLVTDGGFLHASEDLLLPPLLRAADGQGFAVEHRAATEDAALGAAALARDLLAE